MTAAAEEKKIHGLKIFALLRRGRKKMQRQPTADDVRRTYERFRGPWDFEKHGRLRLPLVWKTTKEAAEQINDTPTLEPMRIIEVRLEHGKIAGRKARRLVAELNEPKIEVVLESVFVIVDPKSNAPA